MVVVVVLVLDDERAKVKYSTVVPESHPETNTYFSFLFMNTGSSKYHAVFSLRFLNPVNPHLFYTLIITYILSYR